MYTPRTSVEAIPNASIHHSALQNRDFGHTYDRSRALVRALGGLCALDTVVLSVRLYVKGRFVDPLSPNLPTEGNFQARFFST